MDIVPDAREPKLALRDLTAAASWRRGRGLPGPPASPSPGTAHRQQPERDEHEREEEHVAAADDEDDGPPSSESADGLITFASSGND